MCRLLTAAIAASALASAVPSARAATVTDTAPVAGPAFIDPGQDVLVPVFDPALGTLTGVSVSLTGQLTPGVAFTQASSASLPLGVTFNPRISLNSASQLLASQTVTGQGIGGGNGQAIAAPEAVNLTVPLSLANLPLSPNNPNDLDFYILATSGPTLQPGASFTADLGVLSAQLAVTYTYTPNSGTSVPEPASLALFAAGLLGLGLTRRSMA